MAGGADAGAVGVLVQQAPADAGFAGPVPAVVEVAEMPAGGGAAVGAGRPFLVNFRMAAGAALIFRAVGAGIDPRIGGIVLGRQPL